MVNVIIDVSDPTPPSANTPEPAKKRKLDIILDHNQKRPRRLWKPTGVFD